MRSGFEEFSDAEQAWREAIAALYEMTCEDRPDGPVEGCTCCVSTALAHELASIDRETAPRALMYDFAARALLTWGSERDFRWFVPRILELLADDPPVLIDAGTIASRLLMADLYDWPDAEKEVVREMFVALWGLWLDGGRPGRPPWRRRPSDWVLSPGDILRAAGEVDVDAEPLLTEFAARARGDRPLGEEYASALEYIADEAEKDLELFEDRLQEELGWAARVDDNSVVRFLIGDEGLAQVEEVARHFAGDDLGERLRSLAQRLARLQSALES